MKYLFAVAVCLAILVPSFGEIAAYGQSARPADQQETQKEEDLVHFGDIIDVDVAGSFEFDWRGSLTPEGNLDGLQSYGDPVYGLCRSETQVAADVAKAYSKILRAPVVKVKIIDRSNRAVARMEGGVRTPTRFRLSREVHLRELIVLAGGLTDESSGEITIFRPQNLSCAPKANSEAASTTGKAPSDNGFGSMNIKISELIGGNLAADPQVLSGDLITIAKAVPIYVIGAVINPRLVYVHSEITLQRAIATAGGLAKEADGQKVSIYRTDGGTPQFIDADLFKIKRGESKDEVLKPFDIIDVAAKGSGKRKYPPAARNESRDRAMTNLPLRIVE